MTFRPPEHVSDFLSLKFSLILKVNILHNSMRKSHFPFSNPIHCLISWSCTLAYFKKEKIYGKNHIYVHKILNSL